MSDPHAASHIVGVDGGTTKTIALVCDRTGRIVGAARGGGSNWCPDVEIPMAVVIGAVQDAVRAAGLAAQDVELALCCLAGADWPEDHTRRQQVLEQAGIARRVIVKNDAFAGLRAGAHATYGVVVTAGTGTNTAVIAPDGREWAFGYYVHDGGAASLSWGAIQAVLRQEDGRGQATTLTPWILDRLGYPHPDDLLRAIVAGQIAHQERFALCPLVFAAAEAGDAVATDLLVEQGTALAEYVTAALRRFGMEKTAVDVVLSGSLFKGTGPVLVDTVTQAIHRVCPRARIVRASLEPAVGAVLLGFDALGIVADDQVYNDLMATVPGQAFFSTANTTPAAT